MGAGESPFPHEEAWRLEWDRKRAGEIVLIGNGQEMGGNQAAQIDMGAETFTLRLPDDQAEERLMAEAARLGVSVERVP